MILYHLLKSKVAVWWYQSLHNQIVASNPTHPDLLDTIIRLNHYRYILEKLLNEPDLSRLSMDQYFTFERPSHKNKNKRRITSNHGSGMEGPRKQQMELSGPPIFAGGNVVLPYLPIPTYRDHTPASGTGDFTA
jgi:hypothetical protein